MTFQENTKPIYLQIADRISDDVMSGVYSAGDRIPSVREAAAIFKVNANTMMRAYEYLAQHHIIQNQRGIGFFVTTEAATHIEEMRQGTFYNDELTYFFDRLKSMGISPDHLQKLYTEYKDKQSSGATIQD